MFESVLYTIHNTHTFCCKSSDSEDFYGYNVLGFKNEDWRKNIIKGEPEQPEDYSEIQN